MALQNSDLLAINRGGVNYQVTWGEIDSRQVLATDLIMLQRGSTVYHVPIGDFWDGTSVSQTLDLYMVERGFTLYRHELLFLTGVQFALSDNGKGISTTIQLSASPVNGNSGYIIYPDGTKVFLTASSQSITLTQPGTYTVGESFTEFKFTHSDSTLDASLSPASVWENAMLNVPDFGAELFKNVHNLSGVPTGLKLKSLDKTFEGTSPTTDIGVIDTSLVTSAVGTFLNSVVEVTDNIDIWDVSNVTNMSRMFENAAFYNGDISVWDVDNVTDMSRMFRGASTFDQDLSAWDAYVGNVTNMSGMFNFATQFNSDITTWDVSAVTDMASMFNEADNFNQDIGDWDVGDVADMTTMFNGTNQFDRDLTEWCVRTIASEPTNFATGSALVNANKPVWGTCAVDANGQVILINGTLRISGYTPVAAQIIAPDGAATNIGPGNFSYSKATAGIYTLPMNDIEELSFENNSSTDFDFDPGFYTGNVTNMAEMFNGARRFNGDISNWDTSRVTNMTNMFSEARAFNGDISDWSTGSVVHATNMFYNAEVFNTPIGDWNTGNISNFSGFFTTADAFNQDISNWNVSKATDFSGMFYLAKSFNQPIGSWDITNADTFFRTFYQAADFNQDLSAWDTSNVTNMSMMFRQSGINSPLNWNTSNVQNMGRMFDNAFAFNQDINSWDVRNVTNMGYMFLNARSFNQSLNDWSPNNPRLTRSRMSDMFEGATAMQGDLSNWCVPQLSSIPSDFDRDAGFMGNTAIQPQWGTCPVAGVDVIVNDLNGDRLIADFDFANSNSHDVIFPDGTVVSVNKYSDLDMNQVGTYQFPMGVVEKLQFMGSTSSVPAATNADFTFAPDFYVGGITNLSRMFLNCVGFNGDISNWDISAATCMASMFDNAQSFNGDISAWNTSKVKNFHGAFDGASSFNTDISNWDTSSVTNMGRMFQNATAFNQVLAPWDVGNVTNMSRTFAGATSFNQYLNPWDVANVTNMRNMFNMATSMNEDISNWCVSQFSSKPSGFDNGAAFENDTTLLPDWGTCSSFNGIYLRELVGGTGDFVIGGVAADNTVQIRKPDGTFTNPGTGSFANKYTQLGWYEIKNMESLTGLRFFDNDILIDDTSETAKFYFDDRFDTSNLNEFRQMFREADVFDGDLSMFDTSNATNMAAMFRNNAAFDGDISHFDTGNVNNMANMFRGASSFTGNISQWSTAQVAGMTDMFRNATAFGIDLSGWCVPLIGSIPSDFDTDSGFVGQTSMQPGWGGCPADFTIDTEVVIGTPTGVSPVQYDTVISIATAATTTPTGVTVVSNQWQKSTDGGVTFTDIAGETGVTYTVAGTDRNDQIRLTQVLKNGATSPLRTTTSNALTVEDTLPNPDSYPSTSLVVTTNNASFSGAILHSDGRLWTIPFNARETVGFLATDFTDQILYPQTGSGTSTLKLGGGTIIPDGRILWMNYYARKATIFDPTATNDADRFIDFNSKGGGGLYGFYGAIVSSLNNKIYGLPYRYSWIVEVDPVNYTVTDVPNTSHSQYFYSGVEGPDQKIYLTPGTTKEYAVFDPAVNSFETRALPYGTTYGTTQIGGGGRYVASNNSIYLSAGQTLQIMKLDFNTLDASGHPTITSIDISSITNGGSQGPQYMKAHIRGDGKLIFVPRRSNTPFILLDPTDDSFVGVQNNMVTSTSVGIRFEGSIMMSDGKIIVFPYNASNQSIGVLETYLPNPNDPMSITTNYMQ